MGRPLITSKPLPVPRALPLRCGRNDHGDVLTIWHGPFLSEFQARTNRQQAHWSCSYMLRMTLICKKKFAVCAICSNTIEPMISKRLVSVVVARERGRGESRVSAVARRCSPGTTATAATCRGARRRASAPIPTASGSARSCCSRPRWRRSGPISTQFLARWPDDRGAGRGHARRGAAAWAGARLLRARPQPASPAPKPWSAHTAGEFPTTIAALRRCRGSATTPRRRSRRSPSTSATPRSTAMSSGWWRGSSPIETPLPAAKPRLRALAGGAGAARRGPAISRRR